MAAEEQVMAATSKSRPSMTGSIAMRGSAGRSVRRQLRSPSTPPRKKEKGHSKDDKMADSPREKDHSKDEKMPSKPKENKSVALEDTLLPEGWNDPAVKTLGT